MNFKIKKQNGYILIYLIIIIAVFAMVIFPVIENFTAKLQLLKTTIQSEQAFQIAEAGINYYQWHIVDFPGDYQDGTGAPPPAGGYVHTYTDYDTQQVIGYFSLNITAPLPGETATVIQSTGWTNSNPNIKRTITATYGIPSLASSALLGHDWLYVFPGENYSGPVHSDSGIRFEGTTNSSVTSSVQSTYMDDCNQAYPDEGSCPVSKNAIWANGANQTESSPFWNNPVPKTDFSGISVSFGDVKTASGENGNILLSSSNAQGYSLVFNGDGTVSIYKVVNTKYEGGPLFPVNFGFNGSTDTGLAAIVGNTDYADGFCNTPDSDPEDPDCADCGAAGRCFQFTKSIPNTGLIIYASENLWVEGTVKGRVTVATADTADGSPVINPNGWTDSNLMPNIYIPNNIQYSNGENGSSGPNVDTLGLMAQGNIIVTYGAPDPLYVDAALLSQNGFVAYPICYSSGWPKYNVYFFGSLIFNGSWWFNFTNIGCQPGWEGYVFPHFTWDTNLLYYPAPYFPAYSASAGIQLEKWTSN